MTKCSHVAVLNQRGGGCLIFQVLFLSFSRPSSNFFIFCPVFFSFLLYLSSKFLFFSSMFRSLFPSLNPNLMFTLRQNTTPRSPCRVRLFWSLTSASFSHSHSLHRYSGFAEARALLRDWLTNFVYGLSQNLGPPIGVGEENVEEKMGKLMTNPLVVSVARLVFGLLQSPLLHPTEGLPDER